MKKIAPVFGLVLALLLSSCSNMAVTPSVSKTKSSAVSNAALTAADLKKLLSVQIPKGFDIYVIFEGGGLDAKTTGALSSSGTDKYFFPVSSDKYSSIAQIKSTTEELFTKEFAEKEFYISGFTGENGNQPRYKEQNGTLYVNTDIGGLGWGIEWLTDTLTIKSQSATEIVVEMDTKLFDNPSDKKQLTLKSQNGKWLIDSSLT
jgi:hypothetical protein